MIDYSLRDLESQVLGDFNQEATYWTLSTPWSGISVYTTKVDGAFPARIVLGGSQALGPPNAAAQDQYFERQYSGLPPHSYIHFTAVFWFFDYFWGTSRPVNFYFDGTLVASPTIEPVYDSFKIFGGDIDYVSAGQDLGFDHIMLGASHTEGTLTFRVVNRGLSSFKTQAFGFREISMIFSNYAGTTTPCHFSEANPTVKHERCPCALGMGESSPGNCVACADNCALCTGAAANQCVQCMDGFSFNGNKCDVPGSGSGGFESSLDEAKLGTTLGNIGSNSMRVMTVLNSKSPGFLSIIGLSEIIQYLRYLRINYPPKLKQFFYELAPDYLSLPIDYEVPIGFEKDFGSHDLPDVFTEYEVDSSFLLNYWDTLMSLVITIGLALLFLVAKCFMKGYEKVNKVLDKVLDVLKWNLPLMYFCTSIGDIGFFAILDLKTTKFDSPGAIMSFIASIIALILTAMVLIKSFSIALSFKKKQKEQEFQGYEILYKECKSDSMARVLYITALFSRDFLFNLVIAAGDKAPLFQAAFLLIFSLIMCGYVVIFRPLKELQELLVTLFNEILLLIVNVCVFILAVYDAVESDNQHSREMMGEVIIKISLIFGFLAIIFMIVQIILICIEIYQTIQTYRAKGITSVSGVIKAFIQDFFSEEKLESKSGELGSGLEENIKQSPQKYEPTAIQSMEFPIQMKNQMVYDNRIEATALQVEGSNFVESPSRFKKRIVRSSRIVPHRDSVQMTRSSVTNNGLEMSEQKLIMNGSMMNHVQSPRASFVETNLVHVVSHKAGSSGNENMLLSMSSSGGQEKSMNSERKFRM